MKNQPAPRNMKNNTPQPKKKNTHTHKSPIKEMNSYNSLSLKILEANRYQESKSCSISFLFKDIRYKCRNNKAKEDYSFQVYSEKKKIPPISKQTYLIRETKLFKANFHGLHQKEPRKGNLRNHILINALFFSKMLTLLIPFFWFGHNIPMNLIIYRSFSPHTPSQKKISH